MYLCGFVHMGADTHRVQRRQILEIGIIGGCLGSLKELSARLMTESLDDFEHLTFLPPPPRARTTRLSLSS